MTIHPSLKKLRTNFDVLLINNSNDVMPTITPPVCTTMEVIIFNVNATLLAGRIVVGLEMSTIYTDDLLKQIVMQV